MNKSKFPTQTSPLQNVVIQAEAEKGSLRRDKYKRPKDTDIS